MLEVLLKDDPNPSPEVAEIWAERLGGEQVITYAFLHPRRSAQREGDHSVSALTLPRWLTMF